MHRPALALLIVAVVAAGETPKPQPLTHWREVPPTLAAWWKSADSPAYASAAAHAPAFEDTALWPKLTGKEYFLASQWPKARLYVWAHPGKSGSPRVKNSLDPTDPKNWLLDGKPATELVLDEHADLHFPASDTEYIVGFRGTAVREVARHITVERGARFSGGGDGLGRQIHGNVWIKRGGGMGAQGSTMFIGGAHTFLRNDNPVEAAALNDFVNQCSQYFRFAKSGASVEVIGVVSVLDEYFVHDGATCIVSADSIVHPGRSASPAIHKGGTLALLDGAYWGKWTNEFQRAIDLTCDGTLQGGLPERPLTRSATVGLSFRNWPKHDFSAWSGGEDGVKDTRLVSAIVRGTAQVRSISANPDALLTLTWAGHERTNALGDPLAKAGDAKALGAFAKPEFAALHATIPRKITVFFDAGAQVDGLRFDRVHTGGILLADPASTATWNNLQFGPDNMGAPDTLFQGPVKVGKGGSW